MLNAVYIIKDNKGSKEETMESKKNNGSEEETTDGSNERTQFVTRFQVNNKLNVHRSMSKMETYIRKKTMK